MIPSLSNNVFVFLTAIDMRKSFDTLAGVVLKNNLNPSNGDLYVFTNKSRNRFKVLFWEKGGFWLCAKRLEVGTFAVPFIKEGSDAEYVMQIDLTELRLVIEGIELNRIHKNKRYA